MKIMIHPDIGSNKTLSEREMIILMEAARESKKKLDSGISFHLKDFEVKI